MGLRLQRAKTRDIFLLLRRTSLSYWVGPGVSITVRLGRESGCVRLKSRKVESEVVSSGVCTLRKPMMVLSHFLFLDGPLQ